jgi:hypothetical protein
MDQKWFEMVPQRRRRLDAAAWIPLRASQIVSSIGTAGHPGFKEEYFGAGSIAVALSARSRAESLGWEEIGSARNHQPYVEDGKYYPADFATVSGDALDAVPLVLDQRGNGESPGEWHLHQDLVIALSLSREGEQWLAIDEGYATVARLLRDAGGNPTLLEMRAEQLKDYLCARKMALLVASFRRREEVVENASGIQWADRPAQEKRGYDRWEGRVSEIHEGGMPFGTSFAVLKISRHDVDPDEDAPILGVPGDDAVISRSWTKEREGQKLYRVDGELWRSEWVEPAPASPRVRGDRLPSRVSFVVDTKGSRENASTLVGGGKWLWFRPEVVMTLLRWRGSSLDWYTRDTGRLGCGPGLGVHFGVNRLGLVNVYAKDVALLPDWAQHEWASSNVAPDGGVSAELLAAQVAAEPAKTQAPEPWLRKGMDRLNQVAGERLGLRILREHAGDEEIIAQTHRFRSLDLKGLCSLAKDVSRLIADRIDVSAIQRVVPPPKDVVWRSLKTLENLVARGIGSEAARELMGPLFGAQELRQADAHLPSDDLHASLRLAGVDASQPYVHQGVSLLSTCVSSIFAIVKVLQSLVISRGERS